MKMTVGIIVVIIVVVLLAMFLNPTKPSDELPSADVKTQNLDSNTNTEKNQNEEAGSDLVDFPTENVELNLEFVGFGPGKSHTGTFTDIAKSNIKEKDGVIQKMKIIIDPSSRSFDSETLNEHLCDRESLLDCRNHPEIKFELSGITAIVLGDGDPTVHENPTWVADGSLTFKGTSKEISFPVNVSKDSFKTITFDFRLDLSDFGFGGSGVNKEVQIKGSISRIFEQE